jgi:sulfur-oxidizing protein SoxA
LSARAFLLAAGLALAAAAAAEIPLAERRSGYEFMGRETRAMQDDEATNPAVLWLLDGEALWKRKAGAVDKACAECHGEVRESMRGAAARHPAWDARRGRALNLGQRINVCRVERQQAPALAPEGRELLALSVLVARQSRGMPVLPEANDKASAPREAGRALFFRRQGQLNLSCAQCHDDHWGRSLAGVPIPQAHPTGYPLYRLEWQGVGSLERRIRNCMTGIRAEPYAFGAQEHVDLELYLMWRARGMRMEAPAVRP